VSFLHPVRIAFAGRFQADVSTVNNDVRHYDDASFIPAFQQMQVGQDEWNGWWNPTGSGAFRLVGCRVTGVWYSDGSSCADAARDPLVDRWITGSADRTAAKLVDIDPQWQLASAPWGLQVRACDAAGNAAFRGCYEPNAFRDLWFSRDPNQQDDAAASSTFQSVISDLSWDDQQVDLSRALTELRNACDGRLSVRLTTFGYDGDYRKPTYTLGTLIGTIGPQLTGEPKSFVLGRRFVPATPFSSWAGISYFSGSVIREPATLLLDLSNALQISDTAGQPLDIGRLAVGVLTDPEIAENTPVTPATFVPLAEIPYRDTDWLAATGGVFAAPLAAEHLRLVARHPLALVTEAPFNPGPPGTTGFDAGCGIVAIRESPGGLFVGAEPNVLRIDAPDTAHVTVYAAEYGKSLPRKVVEVRQVGQVPNQGGGQEKGVNTPTAQIPDIGVPTTALEIPDVPPTGSKGTTTFAIQASDPGNPRGYIDGQIYLLDFRLPGQGNTDRHPFDMIVLHVRDAVKPVARPSWKDVAPILQQYANLYPVMEAMVKLGDEQSVRSQRDSLRLAFSVPITDPNAMPATRDLSEGKRQMIVSWLDGLGRGPGATVGVGAPSTAAPRPSQVAVGTEPPGEPVVPSDSKTRFAKAFRQAQTRPGQR
jgi:hypothetical protein